MFPLIGVDWNKRRHLFEFTRTRFLFDEAKMLAQYRVDFDMNALTRIAAQKLNASYCVRISKLPEFPFHKTYSLTMDNGRELVAKIPLPHGSLICASQVATMDFVGYSSCVCAYILT